MSSLYLTGKPERIEWNDGKLCFYLNDGSLYVSIDGSIYDAMVVETARTTFKVPR